MKFTVQSLSTPVQKTEEPVSVESLLTLSEEVHASYQDLSETEKSLEEVQQVVANIDMSIAAIKKYGEQAVQVLNIDGSLTELMGTEVLTNTVAIVDKLNGTKIASLEGFVDKIKEFIAKIIAFVKGVINKINQTRNRGSVRKLLDQLKDAQLVDFRDNYVKSGKAPERFSVSNEMVVYRSTALFVESSKYREFNDKLKELTDTVSKDFGEIASNLTQGIDDHWINQPDQQVDRVVNNAYGTIEELKSMMQDQHVMCEHISDLRSQDDFIDGCLTLIKDGMNGILGNKSYLERLASRVKVGNPGPIFKATETIISGINRVVGCYYKILYACVDRRNAISVVLDAIQKQSSFVSAGQ